jgi:DNA-binding beta-propeller fold protein YncE
MAKEYVNKSEVLHSASVTGTSSAISVPKETNYITVSVEGQDDVWVADSSGNKLIAIPAFASTSSNHKSFIALPIQGMDIKIIIDSGSANVYVTRFYAG